MALPSLREDLILKPSENDADGFPTWHIYDPIKHQYFRVGWAEFEMLSRWSLNDPEKIIESINNETTLHVEQNLFERLLAFLVQNTLVTSTDPNYVNQLLEQHKKSKKVVSPNLLKQYLFFKVKLIRPDRFLDKTLRYVTPFFTKTFLYTMLVLCVISLYLIGRQWDQFINTYTYFFNFKGLTYLFIAIAITKIIHEFAHAYTSKYYGCRISTMGVAFLVLWPVLYTDTTDTWSLTSKRKRMAIGAAGMIAELSLAVMATFLWVFLSDGIVRSVAFFIATVSWVMTIAVNLNPFLRFDGYYLLSDWINVSNLQLRAFALARWWLRELLFKFGDPKPYVFPKKKEIFLIIYSYCTWIYRFFLFLGIAIFIYYMFFKALGIILMLAEIILLLVMPIAKELKVYWQRRGSVTMNKNTKITFSILVLLTFILLFPWRSSIDAPGTLEYNEYTRLYAPHAAMVENVLIQENDIVKKDQVLIVLDSPHINFELNKLKAEIEIVKQRLLKEKYESETLGYKQAGQQDLSQKINEYDNAQKEKDKLTIRAPFAGKVSALEKGLIKDRWLGLDEYLGELVEAKDPRIVAYVPEAELHRISVGNTVRFYPEDRDASPLKAKIIKIDSVSSEQLYAPYQASVYGGDIPVAEKPTEEKKYELTESMYRVFIKPSAKMPPMQHITRGIALIQGQRESYMYRIWRAVSAVLVRESGF